jgi:outer membrane protein assembly factor BamB
VQALDGRTGELIWENRIGPGHRRQAPCAACDLSGQDFSRHHRRALVAFDARNGKKSFGKR